MKIIERIPRSLAKLITWRIAVSISHLLTVWLISGSFKLGIEVMSVAFIVNNILYYVHERTWNLSSWGKEVKE